MRVTSDAALAVILVGVHLLLCLGPAYRTHEAGGADGDRRMIWNNMRFFCEVQVVFSHYVCFLRDRVPTGSTDIVWPRVPDLPASWDLAWTQVVNESSQIYRITCFAFLVGLFSKGEDTRHNAQRILVGTVAPVFLYLGGPAGYMLGSGSLAVNPIMTDRIDAMWFLAAVAVWRLSSSLLRMFAPPLIVLLGIGISAYGPSLFEQGPYNADDAFSFKMAITFFFGFAIGLAAEVRTPQLALVDSWRLRGLCALGLLVLTFAFAQPPFVRHFDAHCASLYAMDDPFTPPLLEYLGLPVTANITNPNARRIDLTYGKAFAFVPRLHSMALALGFGTMVVIAMPQQSTWYSRTGAHNMYPYVLHMLCLAPLHNLAERVLPFRKLSRQAGIEAADFSHELLVWWPYLTLMPVVLTFALGTRPVRLLTWPVVEPTWLRLLFQGEWARYTASSCAELHSIAPKHLGLSTRRHFALWAACEVVVVSTITVVNWFAPVVGPQALWILGLLGIATWQVADALGVVNVPSTTHGLPPSSDGLTLRPSSLMYVQGLDLKQE